jgi:hypothetical protein
MYLLVKFKKIVKPQSRKKAIVFFLNNFKHLNIRTLFFNNMKTNIFSRVKHNLKKYCNVKTEARDILQVQTKEIEESWNLEHLK